MEKSLKRFLSLAMAFLLVLSNVPVQAFATDSGIVCEEHSFVNYVTEATCSTEGSNVLQCIHCGHVESTEVLPVVDHEFVDGVCKFDGCGEVDPNYVPPHECTFVNGVCECGEVDPTYVAPVNDEGGEEEPAPSEESPVAPVNDEGGEEDPAPSEESPVAPVNEDEPDNVIDTEDELRDALSKNGVVVLGGNIDSCKTVTVPTGVTVTLDLNGYYIDDHGDIDSNGDYIIVNQGNLTIEDTRGGGAIKNNTLYPGSLIKSTDTLTINGGTYTSKSYVMVEGGTATITDGIFDAEVIGNSRTTITDGTFNKAVKGAAISAGTYTSSVHNCSISGGTFNIDVSIEEYDNAIAEGYVVVQTDTNQWVVQAEEAGNTIDLYNGSCTIETAGEYVVLPYRGSNTLTIKADATVELRGVNITAAADTSAISIESGNVTLNVTADSTLTGGDNGAGIYVAESASVTVEGGKLTATGNAGVDDASGAAGIGGTWANGNSGTITIDGATVIASGYGVHGSGIGSGSGKVVGEIKIINGANVTAYGGYYANGEGTKLQTDYGKTDPEGGAAIGGGGKTASTIADITISDSTVTAYGGSKAAGIGANFWCNADDITISGNSNVTAQGGSSSAGIGTSRAGDNGVTANIVISGGTVKATGGAYGAGIGGGYNADSLGNGAATSALPEISVTISGGEVTATGGEGGAGIGGGYKTDNVNIDITGGRVTAEAGEFVSGKTIENGGEACAIGDGANGSGKFENSPAVEIGANATVYATTEYGGKPAIRGWVDADADALNNVTVTVLNAPVVVPDLDFTNATGNESGEGWTWDHASKTLTLNGINYSSEADDLIKVPDGSTIVLNGENKIATTATGVNGIYAEGKVTIKGTGSLDITLGSGNAIYSEKAGGDAIITIDGVKLTANGGIATADTAVNASLILKNADVNVARNSISIRNDNGTRGENGEAGTATIKMENSSLYTGPVFVGAHLSSNHSYTRTSAVFSMNGSSIDVQGGGKAAMIFVWGDCGVDFDVVDSNVKIWNSGWQQSDIDIQGGNDHYGVTNGVVIDVNIEKSNLDMYGYWSGMTISRYYGNDAAINFNMDESTVSTMSKYGSSGITIADSTASGTTKKNINDSITFLTNDPGNSGTNMEVNATIYGNPVIHQDYTIVLQTGGTHDFSSVDFDFVLGENQTITIEAGKTFTSAKAITMMPGSSIKGNYVGEVIAAEGYEIVTTGEGDNKVINVKEKTPVARVNGVGFDSLANAVAEANATEGGATVELLQNVTLGEKLTISGNVTISGEKTITRADDYPGTLFAVNAGAALTLDGGLTIDGGNEWTYKEGAPVLKPGGDTYMSEHVDPAENGINATGYMIENFGTLNVNKVTIENNYSTNEAGVIKARSDSNTTIDGATIQHIASNNCGAVVQIGRNNVTSNNATLTIKGDTKITGNMGAYNGGIIIMHSQGNTFNFEGGSIDNNYIVAAGTVIMSWCSTSSNKNTVNMSGGIITKNEAEGYGPMYIHTNTDWVMSGGEISENLSYYPNYVRSNNTATITGGKIVNNTLYIDYAYTQLAVASASPAAISGGTFTQDVSKWLEPDCGLVYDEAGGTYTVTDHVYNLYFRDPATGEQAPYVGPLQGNDLASLIKTGKAFYANYYKMELEVLCNVKIDETAVIDYPMTINMNGKTITTAATEAGTYVDAFTILADVTVTGNGTVDARPSHGYTFYVGDKEGNAGNLTIENGTFYGETSVVNNRLGTVTINDGTFEVSLENEGDPYSYVLNCIDDNYKNNTAKIEVKGGTFYKFNPADNAAEGASTNFVADGYISETTDEGETYTVRAANYVAKVGEDKYESLQAAYDAYEDGVIIELLTDVTLTETFVIEKKNTYLKLNGHNLTGDLDTLIQVKADGTVSFSGGEKSTFKNTGDVFYVESGNVHIYAGCTIVSEKANCIYVRGGNTVVQTATLIANGEYPAIQGNGNYTGNVTLYDTDVTKPSVTADNTDMAIYWPNNGKLTIKGGNITGETAIYAKSGTIEIIGGNITGTGKKAEYVSNNNGATATGDALVIESSSNPAYETPRVTITGGTFTSKNAEAVGVYGDGAPLGKFITGGTFSSDPSEYVVDGYAAVANDDGTWTVVDYVKWIKAELLAGNDVTLTHDVIINDYSYVDALELPSNGNGKYTEVHGNGAVFHVIKPGVELDLNGHSITWDAHDDAYCNKRQVSLFMVTITGNAGEDSSLTVKDSVGTGKVDVYGMGSGMYVVGVDATGTIAGGTWTNYPCKTCGASNIFLYPSHGGVMNITGGTFEQKDSEYLLGWKGSTEETTNNGVGVDYDETKVKITGGTFVNFNPEETKFFDTANSGQETINGCAEGYAAVDNGDNTYTVKPLVTVKFDDVTMVNGNELPKFTYTTNFSDISEDGEMLVVEEPEVTVNDVGVYEITANAYVFMSDKYAIKVIPGKLTVQEAVVEMDGVYYTTIKDALWTLKGADPETHTVKVLKDHDIDVNYSTYNYPILVNGFSIILDMNGKTITADWSKYTGTRVDNSLIGLANGGKLTVTGNGTIRNLSDGKDDVENRIFWLSSSSAEKETILTIENGTFIQEEDIHLLYVEGNKPGNGKQGYYTYIKGGNFQMIGFNDFFNSYDNYEQYTVLSGGTFNVDPTDWELVVHEDFAVVDNGDNTWTVKPQIVVTFDNITMVEGNELPEFTYTTNFTEIADDGLMLVVDEPEVTVNGVGEYEITANAYVFMSDEYAIKVVPGKLTVVDAVAAIGETNYSSLRDAIDAAKDNETVKLLTNVTENIADVAGKTVILDLNKQTVTGTLTVNGNLTVIDSTVAAKTIGAYKGAGWITGEVSEAEGAVLTLEAGNYNQDVNEFTAEDYLAYVNKDNTWTVMPIEVSDYVCWNKDTKVYYTTVNEALEKAAADETVQLLKNTDGMMTYVPDQVTLDLNGFTYETTYMVVFNGGHIVDNSDSNAGRLVASSGLMLTKNNKQLPVNTGNGYMFVDIIKWNQSVINVNGETGNKYGFQAFIEPVAHEALLRTSAESGVKFLVRVSWQNSQGGTTVQDFIYQDQSVWNFINSYGAKKAGEYQRMLAITLKGLSSYDHLTYEAILVSDTGVEIGSHD